MERIRSLNAIQKTALLLILVMVLVFAVLYPIATSRVGFVYSGEIFVPTEVNGSTVYDGKLRGRPASFTVTADGAVTFGYLDTVYGPYTAREDPTAIPAAFSYNPMTGVELRRGDTVIFRGGVVKTGSDLQLYNENGPFFEIFISGGNSAEIREPSIATILSLMDGPQLTHKGQWGMFLLGIVICVVTALCIVFDDVLFHIFLPLWVRGVDADAEPGIWALLRRYTAWFMLLLCALVAFVTGLQ